MIQKYGEITQEQILADELSDIEQEILTLQKKKQTLCLEYLRKTGANLFAIIKE